MQIWDLQSARKWLGAIFLSERVLGQLFLRVLELRVLKKIKLMHGQVVITWRHSENVSNCENGKNLIFQSNVEASTFFISACCEDFFFHRETCAAKDDFMWCDFFFYLCSRLNCLCIMGHSFILYLVNRVFDWKVLCALYIKRLNLWCHLYDNSTSLVINRRKSFFCVHMCLLCMY